MKRSELITTIAESFTVYNHHNVIFSPTKIVDFIVGECEKLGMLPPVYERSPNEIELQAGLEEDDRVLVRKWEDEDV